MKRCRFEIAPGFPLTPALCLLLCGWEVTGALLLAALVHELGHLLMILFLGGRVERITLAIAGAEIEYGCLQKPWQEALSALSGPVAGLCPILLGDLLPLCTFTQSLLLLCGLLSFANLLPALPLDGGRAMWFLFTAIFGEEKGCAITARVSKLVAILLSLCALGLLFFSGSVILIPISAVLLIYSCKSAGSGVKCKT